MSQVVKINILKRKECLTETFLVNFLDDFERDYEQSQETAVDLRQEYKVKAMNHSLNKVSILFAKRYQPVLNSVLLQREEEHLDNLLGHIRATSLSVQEMSIMYKKCFDAFLSSPEISFVAKNVQLLKNVKVKDQFILTLWSMITTRRQTGDNLLQLLCSGASSRGEKKLTIIHSLYSYINKSMVKFINYTPQLFIHLL